MKTLRTITRSIVAVWRTKTPQQDCFTTENAQASTLTDEIRRYDIEDLILN